MNFYRMQKKKNALNKNLMPLEEPHAELSLTNYQSASRGGRSFLQQLEKQSKKTKPKQKTHPNTKLEEDHRDINTLGLGLQSRVARHLARRNTLANDRGSDNMCKQRGNEIYGTHVD